MVDGEGALRQIEVLDFERPEPVLAQRETAEELNREQVAERRLRPPQALDHVRRVRLSLGASPLYGPEGFLERGFVARANGNGRLVVTPLGRRMGAVATSAAEKERWRGRVVMITLGSECPPRRLCATRPREAWIGAERLAHVHIAAPQRSRELMQARRPALAEERFQVVS